MVATLEENIRGRAKKVGPKVVVNENFISAKQILTG